MMGILLYWRMRWRVTLDKRRKWRLSITYRVARFIWNLNAIFPHPDRFHLKYLKYTSCFRQFLMKCYFNDSQLRQIDWNTGASVTLPLAAIISSNFLPARRVGWLYCEASLRAPVADWMTCRSCLRREQCWSWWKNWWTMTPPRGPKGPRVVPLHQVKVSTSSRTS